MKKKNNTVFNFIFEETGTEISPFLRSLISSPRKIASLNNVALEQVVREFAPIYKKHKYTLDGPRELRQMTAFRIFLMCRLANKPELQKILNE